MLGCAFNRWDCYSITLVCIGILGGFGFWAGEFDKIPCPYCTHELEYNVKILNLSESHFYCENCGILNLPPAYSGATEPATPSYYREKGKIIGNCIVCNLSITEFEEQLICPFCFSLAHETHLLEWVKIKGYCPHCNAPLNNNLKKIYHD